MPKWPTQNVEPSTYVFEMITFLTANVDAVLIGLGDETKARAYAKALSRINNWLMVGLNEESADIQETLCGKEVPRLNEAALAKVLADVNFIELEIQRLGRPGLDHVFDEVKLVRSNGLTKLTENRPSMSFSQTRSRRTWNRPFASYHILLSDHNGWL